MALTWCQRIKRFWPLAVAGFVLAGTIIAVVWIPLYYVEESSHYHDGTCPVSNCTITDTRINSYANVQETWYSGFFNYSITVNNVTYTELVTFNWYDPNNYDSYSDCKSANLSCSYDDRNIQATLSLNPQPDLSPLPLAAGLVGFVGIVVVFLCIMTYIYYHNLRRARKAEQLTKASAEVKTQELTEVKAQT
jgi:hypothetical protein